MDDRLIYMHVWSTSCFWTLPEILQQRGHSLTQQVPGCWPSAYPFASWGLEHHAEQVLGWESEVKSATITGVNHGPCLGRMRLFWVRG
ncbi:uncharacterized protein BJX67DRAFT_356713 [Aspergillus lucknowensis]|uniref:Uncharacterized protein n=1 Tax=Aspergillus lucknowensis TaxID=176173 RepID=A0ABR4LNR0_9EURO